MWYYNIYFYKSHDLTNNQLNLTNSDLESMLFELPLTAIITLLLFISVDITFFLNSICYEKY